MPQIDVQYTADLAMDFDRPAFARDLHQLMEREANAPVANCKTKFHRVEEAVIADGTGGADLVHVQVSLFHGRTAGQLAAVRQGVLDLLTKHVALSGALFSVETRSFDSGDYAKAVR
jgi:5-carboxymethyl-2-hydroxymuconate isomerase